MQAMAVFVFQLNVADDLILVKRVAPVKRAGIAHRGLLYSLVSLAACLLILAGTGHCAGAAKDSACGPFGDPPADTINAEKPSCWGGKLLGPWNDSNGTARYACVYEPTPKVARDRLPMVVYLHPSMFGTETIQFTNLLHYQDVVSLRGDHRKNGYFVLAPAGRKTTHYYPFPDKTGMGWDNWYRQLNPAGDVKIGATIYRENVDAAAIDHFIAEEEAGGKVDADRIYMTGWSNGAAMAYLYALNRPKISAVAVYSAPDPFGALNDSCPQTPVTRQPRSDGEIQIFNPRVPTLHVHNACDVAGLCPNCEKLSSELTKIGVSVEDYVVNSLGEPAVSCMRACGVNPNGDPSLTSNPLGWSLGMSNHSRWPLSWTRTMLYFFRGNSLQFVP
jgi:dienelactone hydrolase